LESENKEQIEMKSINGLALILFLIVCSYTLIAQDSLFDKIYNSDTTGNGFMQQHAGAKPNLDKSKTISVDNFKQMMKEDKSLVILDVRNPDELKGPLGKIDGSINIPLKDLESRISELDPYKDKTIAVICKLGVRSASAQKILIKHGFKSINVKGGMEEYRRSEKD
jgi:rhodanese-related sulfurtransferase